MNYRAEIDGLRAIAVVSVIFYHAKIVIFGRDWFEGGFVGVDIFFVISGYLITRIILTELEQTNTFSFKKFYYRRARRILPMLLVVIGVCIPFAWQKLLPLDLVEFAESALSAIGFGSNFFFYFSTTEYGAESALLKPLLHTWSLGVEEQFYIIVPIIILLIWKFARAFLLSLLIGMLIMSIQFADVMEVINSELNFFLPFSRFWELLVGSALALIELKYGRSKNPILTQTLPIIGLFLIAHSILFFDAETPHPSFQTLIPILGVALVLAFCSTEDIVGKLLSYKPIVSVGLISYSLYLWHFPIFAFGRIGLSNPSTYDKIEWLGLAFALSVVSYFLIEKPFRNIRYISNYLFLTLTALLCVLLIATQILFIENKGFPSRLPQSLFETPNEGYRTLESDGHLCHSHPSLKCEFKPFGPSKFNVILLGDSHADSLSNNLLSQIQKREIHANFIHMTVSGCPLAKGFQLNRFDMCSAENQSKRLSFLMEQEPSIVIYVARMPMYLTNAGFDNGEGGVEAGKNSFWLSQKDIVKNLPSIFRNTFEQISHKHQLILVYPIPETGWNIKQMAFSRALKRDKDKKSLLMKDPITTDYNVYIQRTMSTFVLFDSVTNRNIHRIYPHKLFCDNLIKSRCITHDNDKLFYDTTNYLNFVGAEIVNNLIMEKIIKIFESNKLEY